ncbi:putative LON peptidase N-terminal domain and RING finger protein 1 [Glarea lozoyensis 74030]|uniref:Putative LON peptidase N-terminal domain and RING finger protein 1 n=1 Tax=Glarea lozoyensis (strain ATCC 74030 / MF5533) TaxID=1104152 RepID=H0ECP9_GLAL7|nr:putative LON peptidase N-terminal domain and RING finger protein 1 [Glarea lozoyensis 74030]
MHVLPDGRSLIETVGVSRFRILEHATLDGYMVGKVERIEDMSLAAEETLEAAETSISSARPLSSQDHFGAPPDHPRTSPPQLDLTSLSTQQLMEIGTSFVEKMRRQSAPWLHTRVFTTYGEMPTDPATFPWWFASVLPIAESEKYRLLQLQSVRERLKYCAGWIAQLEAQRCECL